MYNKAKKLLKPGAQVLQLTHQYCADGTGCAVVLENCPINLTTIPVKFSDIDNLMLETDFSKYDVVLITDISPTNESFLDLSDNIILIDHHDTAQKFKDEDKMRYISDEYCGTVLTIKFAEDVFDIDLSFLYDFATLTNDYDMWIQECAHGKDLNLLYYHLWHEKYLERFIDGDINFTDKERKFIQARKQEIVEVFKVLEVINIDMEDGCLIQATKYVNELCENLMNEEGYKFVITYNPNNNNSSIRTNYDEVHVGNMLEEFGFGGGHPQAGGMYEPDIDLFQAKVKTIVNKVKELIGEN